MPRIRTALTVAACIAVTVTAVAAAAAPRRVAGSLHDSTCPSICVGHNALADDVHGSHVWCAWNGTHVRVHITLRNSSGDDLDLRIQPTYHVLGHGRHGSSYFSRRSVHLSAHSSRQWFGDAGRPEGVVTGTPISSCEPALKDVTQS